ncbi:nose resistant to fluoxetine protein 6-like isoform X2 [Anthonomus grandis grandis]|uniref:nose resistant to fluoxetine protein 6-like isoform X2 n=1 Tax=Anthonomus grandis grandis TaxID=2921223 RepID=UPI0021667639|nr:nose resistant to fluoxetine protein 6-like isoform X2 [Anthonomus grandis grandis]
MNNGPTNGSSSYKMKTDHFNADFSIFDMWKSFPFDIFSNLSYHTISSKCQDAYQRHLDGVRRNDFKSLKLFDATAKPSSGLLSGNLNQYGNFDQCLTVPSAQYCLALIDLEPLWKSTALAKYATLVHSYYSIKETFKDPIHRVPGFTYARWGFCIPRHCTFKDLSRAIYAKLGVRADIRTKLCQISGEVKTLFLGDYLARAYFFIIMAFVVVSSALYGRTHCNGLWTSFAIQKNFKQLFQLSVNDKEYKSVHGVRFFSALALLMAHKTMASLYNPYINKTQMAEGHAMKWSVIGRNAIIYTDCFLLISGLLNANALFSELEKTKGINFKEKLVNRLFRIVPGLLTVILFCTYLLPYMGAGPLWPMVITHHSDLCKQHMWRNLLFVHNYFGFKNMCLTHTHQLGIDMQLFLVTPIFVLLLWRSKAKGLYLMAFFALVSTALRFINTYYYNLSHVVHFGIPISRMFDTADYSYILPTHRASIYLMGVFLAWILKYQSCHHVLLKNKLVTPIWALAYILGFTTWFAPMKMCIGNYEYNNLEAALYGAIYPFTWGGAVAWVIYAVENGFGSWFTAVLTWKYFRIFTKIAYGVYLVQFPVFFYNVGVTRYVGEFNHFMMLPPMETISILFFAILLTLFVEMPFQNVYKCIKLGLVNVK